MYQRMRKLVLDSVYESFWHRDRAWRCHPQSSHTRILHTAYKRKEKKDKKSTRTCAHTGFHNFSDSVLGTLIALLRHMWSINSTLDTSGRTTETSEIETSILCVP